MCDLCNSDCGNYDEVHGFCGHGIAREEVDDYIRKIAEEYRRGRRTEAIRIITAHLKANRREVLQEQFNRLEGFCKDNGGREVHRSWRDNMLMQERDVSDERMNWDTLPYLDKELDAMIAKEVIEDFLTWAMGTAIIEEA